MGDFARITSCSYNLFHVPELSFRYGSSPEAERKAKPESEFLTKMAASLRSFGDAAVYPPNRAFIGTLDPLEMPSRPWSGEGAVSGADSAAPGKNEHRVSGPFGDILDELLFLGLLKYSDRFDLVLLEAGFSAGAGRSLSALALMKEADLSKFDEEVTADRINEAVEEGALPLFLNKELIGCVKAAHPDDLSLSAHVIFENLASKAGAVYSVLKLFELSGCPADSIDYIIETSEEACGDANQRGGGNFAKAVGELAGLSNATGSDTRSFCAGPVHGLLQAAALVKSGTFKRVVVTAGGATAKLAMNCKKHVGKGFPVLEDCLGGYALLVEADSGKTGGIRIRNDIVGIHRIGSGSSPQHVIQNLVADPLEKAGLGFDEIGYYAPELHNPEITEAGGAGNVTHSNLKMIAAMAVMKKQLERSEIDSFIDKHGSAGWAPTQGHIPSGIPALGWIMKWFETGRIGNAMVIGKGSLFLGRMTGLFDGVSILLESGGPEPKTASGDILSEPAEHRRVRSAAAAGVRVRVGLTIPGSESGAGELLKAASDAEAAMKGLEVVTFGTAESDPDEARRMMEKALADGGIDSAVTFHYPFPIGTATIGLTKAPGSGRDIFIASTTGITDTDRVMALVKNAVAGVSAAKAWGIERPAVGVLNLDGARAALKRLKTLKAGGWRIELTASARGDELLRGNDILAGTADVIVCDTLSGNAFIKMLAAYDTGGRLEVSGSGYGPGLGADQPLINIISRASGAAAAANAIIYSAKMASADLRNIYAGEMRAAEAAGLFGTEGSGQPAGGDEPARKTVDHEIEGIDVLQIEDAVKMLMKRGIYCEAGMGCTGPVIMIAAEDLETAGRLLAGHGYTGGIDESQS